MIVLTSLVVLAISQLPAFPPTPDSGNAPAMFSFFGVTPAAEQGSNVTPSSVVCLASRSCNAENKRLIANGANGPLPSISALTTCWDNVGTFPYFDNRGNSWCGNYSRFQVPPVMNQHLALPPATPSNGRCGAPPVITFPAPNMMPVMRANSFVEPGKKTQSLEQIDRFPAYLPSQSISRMVTSDAIPRNLAIPRYFHLANPHSKTC
ncbi:uncharacterized protein LOC114526296 [Dendronephthya gigantea]|uniref:uncharacterized protein LOC114526296 n=1 Tax=Dendronephthya gigantea TaxID=151771 RepID=UPI00106963E4|nr:uncharacterized protein LOC114526296 [Dendronephthya gigantea]